MKPPGTLLTIAAALLLATGARAQERPDFTGRWTLDPAATTTAGGGRGDRSGAATGGGGGGGGGIGLGSPADELVIQQNDSTLRVEERRADASVTVLYRLDGKRITNAMQIGRGGSTPATYSTRWDGSKLVTTINRSITARGTTTNFQYREVRSVSDDGSMIVETTVSGRPGGRTAIYRKG